MLAGRRVVVCVSGGIAAYKLCEVVSTLAKAGAQVRVILSAAAERFVSPLTFATLARERSYTDADFWSAEHGAPLHITLGQWAEVLLIAPLTADLMARLAMGIADDLITNTVLASTAPILLAPAMNTEMWLQPPVERNWQYLQSLPRFHASGPTAGRLACDTVGSGRMSEPQVLVDHLRTLLWTGGRRDLTGKTVLVTGGGTREFIDPVRFIGNPSSGRMGIAVALAAAYRGADVHLVAAHNHPEDMPAIVRVHPVTTAAQMQQTVEALFDEAHLTVMTAAVADVRPRRIHPQKLPKSQLGESLELEAVDDIIQGLARRKKAWQTVVGFAAQTGDDLLSPAWAKLAAKHLDFLVANRVDWPDQGFGSDKNQAMLLSERGDLHQIPLVSKLEMAHRVLDLLEKPE